MSSWNVRIHLSCTFTSAFLVKGAGRHHLLVDHGPEFGPDGRLYIPGSTVKGRLRAHLEAFLRGQGVPVCRPPRPDQTCPHHGPSQKALASRGRQFCPVCEVFGSPWLPARFTFGSLYPATNHWTGQRTSVAVSRRSQSAEEQRLLTYQVVHAATDLPSYRGTVHGRGTPADLGLLLVAASLVTHLGSFKGRGLGEARLVAETVEICEREAKPWREAPLEEQEGWIARVLDEVRHIAA